MPPTPPRAPTRRPQSSTRAPTQLALGATALDGDRHVYADPAGHPFCLIRRPSWAAPIDG